MKKVVIILSIMIAILCINKEEKVPKESIRFRIIANSDNENDQLLKKAIVKNISKELLNSKATTIEEERTYLQKNLPSFVEKIKEVTDTPYTINYGENYFPEKEWNGETYEAGFYESLVITLGEGKGANFWCILFPPLCMIDEEEDIEYTSFLKESLEKIFRIK